MWCPKRLGTSLLTLLSEQGELFPFGKFTTGAEQCQPEGWDAARKMKLFSFLFCALKSCFCLAVLLKFLK